MKNFLLIIHFIIASGLVGIILIQRSEGGALGGLGGGGGMGLMSARGTANLLTRVTTVLAATFFATSLVLAIMFRTGADKKSIVDVEDVPAATIPFDGATPDAPGDTPTSDLPKLPAS